MKTSCLLFAFYGLFVLSVRADLSAVHDEALMPFLEQHCYDCHDDITTKGGLNLLDLSTDVTDPALMQRWSYLWDRVETGEMPPEDKARPDESAREAFLSTLGQALTQVDAAQREVVLRRLNRVEYENTIRDLFDVEVSLAAMFPEDASKHGFDKVGEALGISSEQMEIYLQAADAALDAAIGPEKEPERIHLKLGSIEKTAERHLGKLFNKPEGGGIGLYSSGYCPSNIREFRSESPGTYRVRIEARALNVEDPLIMVVYGGDVVTSRRERHTVDYWSIAPGKKWTVIEFEDRIDRSDSFHPKPFNLVNFGKNEEKWKGPGIALGKIEIEGPLEEWPPPSRRKLLGDVDPEMGAMEDIEAILTELLPRAFRRTTKPEELESYLTLARSALEGENPRPWMEALRYAIKGVLCSPEFLFLDEPGRERIEDFALASRLSYFLWSSMPDKALLSLAAKGELSKPEVLRGQVERLLEDERSTALVEEFTGQWLKLREINFTEPDDKLYPEFDDLLRDSMVEESKYFFREVLEENLAVTDFVDSDWTFLNQRLAEHYGIEGVAGQNMRRVSLPADSVRGGVITQGSVLKVTANGTNTSPVLRGVWMLENIIGRPAPPPPPNVPAVEPDITGAVTLREQLKAHSNSDSCAGCHVRIDPPGFALESFDVIGGWRENYRTMGEGKKISKRVRGFNIRYRVGLDVDSTGVTPDGFEFADIEGFKKWLMADPEIVTHCMTEKLITYGTGRGTGFSDRAVMHEIVKESLKNGNGFRDLIHLVVQSPAFYRP